MIMSFVVFMQITQRYSTATHGALEKSIQSILSHLPMLEMEEKTFSLIFFIIKYKQTHNIYNKTSSFFFHLCMHYQPTWTSTSDMEQVRF